MAARRHLVFCFSPIQRYARRWLEAPLPHSFGADEAGNFRCGGGRVACVCVDPAADTAASTNLFRSKRTNDFLEGSNGTTDYPGRLCSNRRLNHEWNTNRH